MGVLELMLAEQEREENTQEGQTTPPGEPAPCKEASPGEGRRKRGAASGAWMQSR